VTSKLPALSSLFLAHLVTDIYMPVISAIIPLLILTYGYSYLMAGLLVTAYNLTSSLFQPVFGWLSDNKGWQIQIWISLLISATFISFMGIIPWYALLLVFAALAALGHASFHPSALTLVSKIASGENRGRITSLFVVGGNVGYSLGPFLAGALVLYFGLPGLLVLLLPALVTAVLLKKILPPSRPGPVHFTSPEEPPAPSLRPLTLLFAAATFRAWAVFSAITFIPPLLVTRGYDIFIADLAVTLMLLAGVAGQVIGGSLSDIYGKKEFVLAGLGLSLPAFFLFLFTEGWVSIAGLVLFGFFLWSSFAITVAMSHELAPHRIGFASGVMLGVAMGAGGVGVAVNGYLADQFGLVSAFIPIPALIFIAALLMFLLRYPWKILKRTGAGQE
jgi:FSR family fosmidomycin resistance protein-like MFS transporter